jgi:hypothetical protein
MLDSGRRANFLLMPARGGPGPWEEFEVKKALSFIALPVALLVSSAAFAQSASQNPAAPKPAPQMAQLNYFVGTWSCIGAQPYSVFGDDHEIQALAVGSTDLNGFWLQLRFTELRTGDNDDPGAWTYQIGYDTVGKQIVASWTDNYGGWGMQTSPGWDGNKLVLTGTYYVDGQKITARDTFEQANGTTMAHLSELEADKVWTTLDSETCHKN